MSLYRCARCLSQVEILGCNDSVMPCMLCNDGEMQKANEADPVKTAVVFKSHQEFEMMYHAGKWVEKQRSTKLIIIGCSLYFLDADKFEDRYETEARRN